MTKEQYNAVLNALIDSVVIGDYEATKSIIELEKNKELLINCKDDIKITINIDNLVEEYNNSLKRIFTMGR